MSVGRSLLRHSLILSAAAILALSSVPSFASMASQRETNRGSAEDRRSASDGIKVAQAGAANTDAMLGRCRTRAAAAFRTSGDLVNVKYEGQRVDGTHAVNGSVDGPAAGGTFQCSFNSSGGRIVRFTRVSGPAQSARRPAQESSTVSAADRRACIAAVRTQTRNPRLVVLRTEFSQANNSVTVGVGPQRAPWRCLVKRGVVAEVMSMVDEGRL
jgi:hypothetical protein